MYELPTTVDIDGNVFHIRRKGDFRVILDCFAALQDDELDKEYKILTAIIIFYEEFDSLEDTNKYGEFLEKLTLEMFKFINCGQDNQRGAESEISLINWEDDSQIICAAVNNVAKQEVRILEYLHWWTFLGYYMSVGQSVLSTVVSIRDKVYRGKKLDKWEQDFKKENPQFFVRKQPTIEREFEKELRNLWNGGD